MISTPITFVTPWYGHFAGGAEVAARSFAEQLIQRGFAVQVLTTCCRSPFESWWVDTLPEGIQEINGVIVHRFPVNSKGEEIFHKINRRLIEGMHVDEDQQRQFVQNSINSDSLVKYTRDNTEGHVVIGMPYTQGLIYSVVQALESRASIMPCLHDEPQFRWKTTAEMLEKSMHIFFLAEEEKTIAIREHGRQIGRRIIESLVVGVGVELPSHLENMIGATEFAQDIRAKYKLPENFFVFMGRKDIGKNIFNLVRYFKDYRLNGGKAALIFLGGGDTNLVPKEGWFIDFGFIPEEEKYSILSQSLGLINLSEKESFSIVIMEAWLCGVPVIVSGNCAVTMAHCRRSGGGIPVSSSYEFQSALKMLEDPMKREPLAIAGKHYTRSNYSWNHVLDRFVRGMNQK